MFCRDGCSVSWSISSGSVAELQHLGDAVLGRVHAGEDGGAAGRAHGGRAEGPAEGEAVAREPLPVGQVGRRAQPSGQCCGYALLVGHEDDDVGAAGRRCRAALAGLVGGRRVRDAGPGRQRQPGGQRGGPSQELPAAQAGVGSDGRGAFAEPGPEPESESKPASSPPMSSGRRSAIVLPSSSVTIRSQYMRPYDERHGLAGLGPQTQCGGAGAMRRRPRGPRRPDGSTTSQCAPESRAVVSIATLVSATANGKLTLSEVSPMSW